MVRDPYFMVFVLGSYDFGFVFRYSWVWVCWVLSDAVNVYLAFIGSAWMGSLGISSWD